jgi:hypothetical protein
MKNALLGLLSSKKFMTWLLGMFIALGAKYGFHVDPEVFWTLVGLTGVLLGAQGATDHGKAAAMVHAESMKEEPKLDLDVGAARSSEAGFVSYATVLIIAGVVLICMSITACAMLRDEAKHEGRALIDCTTKSAKDTIATFGATVDEVLVSSTAADGSIDRDRVKAATKGFATNTAKCVLADAIARALNPKPDDPNAPKSSPLEAKPDELHALFADLSGGASYKTEHGLL